LFREIHNENKAERDDEISKAVAMVEERIQEKIKEMFKRRLDMLEDKILALESQLSQLEAVGADAEA
jgi:bacterioferritin (cytochrome b1)